VAEGRVRELGVARPETPEELYAVSDFVPLHLASTPETRDFVGDDAFAAMKPGARLINAARGDLVDQDALLRALEDGRLGGAAIDRVAVAPLAAIPVLGLLQPFVPPHLG